jgi:hypothetical protein
MRLRAGGWFSSKQKTGLGFDFIALTDADWTYRAASTGSDIIARPFTNVDPALGMDVGPDSELISYPNLHAGWIQVDSDSRFRSFALPLIYNLRCHNGGADTTFGGGVLNGGSRYRIDLLAGYRFMRLDENVVITHAQVVSVMPQAGFDVYDRFEGENQFNGLELGVSGEYYWGKFAADGLFKLALGRTNQSVAIDGRTDLSIAGAPARSDPGGLLALPTNMGIHSRKKTDLVLEFGFNVGYMLSKRLKATFGYTLIYWPHVVRPGDQMNLNVNGSYIPDPTGATTPAGPAAPSFSFNDSHYWAQGINFGLDYRW